MKTLNGLIMDIKASIDVYSGVTLSLNEGWFAPGYDGRNKVYFRDNYEIGSKKNLYLAIIHRFTLDEVSGKPDFLYLH